MCRGMIQGALETFLGMSTCDCAQGHFAALPLKGAVLKGLIEPASDEERTFRSAFHAF